jgi:hypothetical protein
MSFRRLQKVAAHSEEYLSGQHMTDSERSSSGASRTSGKVTVKGYLDTLKRHEGRTFASTSDYFAGKNPAGHFRFWILALHSSDATSRLEL